MTNEDRQVLIQAFLEGRLDEADSERLETMLREDPSLAASLRVQMGMDTLLRAQAGRQPQREDLLASLRQALAAPAPVAARGGGMRRLLTMRAAWLAAAACLLLAMVLRLVSIMEANPRDATLAAPAPIGQREHLASVVEHQGRVLASGERHGLFNMGPGDRLQTVTADSHATLHVFGAEAQVQVAPESQIRLDGTMRDPILALEGGTVTVFVEEPLRLRSAITGVEVRGAQATWQATLHQRGSLPLATPLLWLSATAGEAEVLAGDASVTLGEGESAWINAAGVWPSPPPALHRQTLSVRGDLRELGKGQWQVTVRETPDAEHPWLLGRTLALIVPGGRAPATTGDLRVEIGPHGLTLQR